MAFSGFPRDAVDRISDRGRGSIKVLVVHGLGSDAVNALLDQSLEKGASLRSTLGRTSQHSLHDPKTGDLHLTIAAGATAKPSHLRRFSPAAFHSGHLRFSVRRTTSSEGKERDAETGNDDFGARYYSNRFGRWLSADWSAVPAPVPYANLTNPQTLNLYSMVADDPESFADLDGHDGQGGCAYNVEKEANQRSSAAGGRNNCTQEKKSEDSTRQQASAATAQNSATGQPKVRFEGDGQVQRKKLKKAWHHLITHSAHAKALLNKDLKEKGDLKIRPTNHGAYYDPNDNSINVDPEYHPNVYTSRGVQRASTEIIMGHELAHGVVPRDDGPNNMNNVNANENPIRHDLGLPDRIKYELAPDNPH